MGKAKEQHDEESSQHGLTSANVPRWCLTFLRAHFFATFSVMTFLCMRRKTTVQAISRGFLRWFVRDSL